MKTLIGAADGDDMDEMTRTYRENYQRNFGKLSGVLNLRDYAHNAMLGAQVRFLNAMNNIME